jgi:hypothetical protein
MKYQISRNENGQASLLITAIFALVMASIVVGLSAVSSADSSQIVSRNQSLQATYAAESGINDVVQAIKTGVLTSSNIPPLSSQTCSSITSVLGASGYYSNLGATATGVSYNCLYVQDAPSNLQFSVTSAQSTVVPIDPSPSTGTSSLTISWAENAGSTESVANCSTSEQFTPIEIWTCPFPVLRMDLYNYNASDTTAQLLNNDTDSFILFPVNGASGVYNNIAFDQNLINGYSNTPLAVDDGNCSSSTGTCSVTLNFSAPFTNGDARLTMFYGNSDTVTIAGASGTSFGSTQIEIDATGVDRNVLRRIEVRVPASTTATIGTTPSYAVDGGVDVCKEYSVDGPGSDAYPSLAQTNLGNDAPPWCGDYLKPAIYLYPTHTELVNVKLYPPTGFGQTIPTYNPDNGWNVVASPNGNLIDLLTDKSYPYLYWEGNLDSFNYNMSQGFVISGSDSSNFLSHELPIIGLNKTETTAFMQYWVPKLEHNKYDLIHFAGSEYTSSVPLDITPKPTSLLRVFMVVEPVSSPIQVTPQTFSTFHRVGFTAVEWGGTLLSH